MDVYLQKLANMFHNSVIMQSLWRIRKKNQVQWTFCT